MIRLDHIALWTRRRDELLAALCDAAGMGVIDGYAPGGRVVARGVRFANGPFLDIMRSRRHPMAAGPFTGWSA